MDNITNSKIEELTLSYYNNTNNTLVKRKSTKSLLSNSSNNSIKNKILKLRFYMIYVLF